MKAGLLVGTVIPAIGRNPGEKYGRHHLYKYVEHTCNEDGCDKWRNQETGEWECCDTADLLPMCIYGWNRSGGFAFSILRNNIGSRGECQLCRKNVDAGKPPAQPNNHRTAFGEER